MSYNNQIPRATDLISNSQGQIQGNFVAIDSGTTQTGTGFARNHVTMTDGTNGGLHNRIDFYQALTDPVIAGFVASLYPKTVGSDEQLTYSNSSTVTQITGPFSKTNNGYCFLPGGILLKWGSFAGSSGINTFSFPTSGSIPVFSAVYQVFLQPSSAPGAPNYFGYIDSKTTTGFTYDSVARTSNTSASGTYSYLAIGAA